ncbi:putative serine/threonine-protein kinase nek2 [Pseudocercospora fuligena]|uniref:Putative serine/threonine-protein kinase nek2 n=1 Tax=Pseudocercospora fuligena TaxID=685502 RepID=A0A8H6RVR4_9PEZI|nr:putative serine/threonine-protein kinase nek2 [Pseudocercospora fuligena]
MDNIDFLAYASGEDCKTTEALLRIRVHASKQSSVKREEEYEVAEDADLLPTLERLRRAFPSAEKRPETLRTIQDLLNCDCVLCVPQHGALNNARRERDLAAEIVDSNEKLKAFSALALSGCLFATREFLRSNADDVDDFSKLVRRPAGQQIRWRLFRFVDISRTECEECSHDGPPNIHFNELCPKCAADRFRESIRPKVQLMKVVGLTVSHDDLDEFYGNVNLPFISEHQILEGQSRASVKFSRCSFEPGYCELHENDLFRKRYKFKHGSDGAKMREAENEARIALLLRNRSTPGIANILMAFTEHRDQDLGFTFINLVFRREQHSLKDYFRESSLSDHLAGFSSHSEHHVVLEHGLWKSLLDIVEAAASIHEADDTVTDSKGIGQRKLGHLDIKPANILIGRSKNLLLTDFGQAARRTIGTNDYAPPEAGTGSVIDLTDKYDVWSLACLLTEALVFLKAEAELGHGNGPRAIQNFYSRRLHQTTHNQSAAFWINLGSRDAPNHSIRSSVLSELDALESIRHPQTQRVVRQLQRMLSIDPHQRPHARACQKQFKTGVGREIFRNPGDISVEPQLELWKTSFTTRVHHDPIPCRLFLHQIPPDELDLTLECDGDPMYLRPGIARLAEVVFEPLSFFRHTGDLAERIQRCNVSRLLRGITLHFLEPVRFFEFMTLLTCQKLLPDVRRDATCRGARMKFTNCELEPRKWTSSLRSSSEKQVLVNGFVQIWECLSDREYKDRYCRESGPGSDSSDPSGRSRESSVVSRERIVGRIPDSERRKYKMALFGYEQRSNSCTCTLVDVGTNSFTLKSSAPSMVFTRAPDRVFQAVTYGPNSEGYPGFPCSPEIIDQHFRDEKRYSKLSFLQLTMHKDSDFDSHTELHRIVARICGSD